MVKTDEIRGLIAKHGLSQADVAKAIGISSQTFYRHMESGVFGSDEMEKMIEVLHIENPGEIFFASNVT